MTYSITQRNCCRACSSKDLQNFMTLPSMPLPVGHTTPEKRDQAFLADLPLYWCPQCLLVQTQHDVDLTAYYENYAYAVSISPFIQEIMEKLATTLWETYSLQKGDAVLEIGSSDGLQLKKFKDRGAHVLGFEPSKDLARVANEQGIETIAELFDEKAGELLPEGFKKAHVVLSQFTFDHLPEPLPFLKQVRELLDEERGIVVIEVHDFEKMVERNEACLFTHEHATYATRDSMANMFELAGLKLIGANILPEQYSRGNSLIVVGACAESQHDVKLEARSSLLTSLESLEAYETFAEDVITGHQNLAEHIRSMKQEGHRVAGYGGVGRGVNTLAIAGIEEDELVSVYDKNTKLHGLCMPGCGIIVRPPEEVFQDKVDEVIVFSYGYMDEIKAFMKSYLEQGGKVSSLLDYIKS